MHLTLFLFIRNLIKNIKHEFDNEEKTYIRKSIKINRLALSRKGIFKNPVTRVDKSEK